MAARHDGHGGCRIVLGTSGLDWEYAMCFPLQAGAYRALSHRRLGQSQQPVISDNVRNRTLVQIRTVAFSNPAAGGRNRPLSPPRCTDVEKT
jgi:hypothetical protein